MVTTFEMMMCITVDYCCLRCVCVYVYVCVVVVSTRASPNEILSNSTSLTACIQL